MKLTTKQLKYKPYHVACLSCSKKLGFVAKILGILYFVDVIAFTKEEFEKNINVLCWNCGTGHKVSTKKTKEKKN